MIFPLIAISAIGIVCLILKRSSDIGKISNKVAHPHPQSVAILINGSEYLFPHETNQAKLMKMAITFCSSVGPSLGFTMQTFADCVSPLAERLQSKMIVDQSGATNDQRNLHARDQHKPIFSVGNLPIEGSSQGGSILEIGDEKKELTNRVHEVQNVPIDTTEYIPIEQSSQDTSASDVMEETNELAVPVIVSKSLSSIEFQDTDNSSTNGDIGKGEVSMTINGVNYIFQYPPDLKMEIAAEQMAIQFCQENASDVGIDLSTASEEYLENICSKPLAVGLLETMVSLQIESH